MVVFFFAEFYLNNRCTVYPIVLQVFSFQLIMFSILDVCVCLKLDYGVHIPVKLSNCFMIVSTI